MYLILMHGAFLECLIQINVTAVVMKCANVSELEHYLCFLSQRLNRDFFEVVKSNLDYPNFPIIRTFSLVPILS